MTAWTLALAAGIGRPNGMAASCLLLSASRQSHSACMQAVGRKGRKGSLVSDVGPGECVLRAGCGPHYSTSRLDQILVEQNPGCRGSWEDSRLL